MKQDEIIKVLDIKEDCLIRICKIINIQLKLVRLAKNNHINFNEFCEKYNELERLKNRLIVIKNECTEFLKEYS